MNYKNVLVSLNHYESHAFSWTVCLNASIYTFACFIEVNKTKLQLYRVTFLHLIEFYT
jgi:hypothetical protein